MILRIVIISLLILGVGVVAGCGRSSAKALKSQNKSESQNGSKSDHEPVDLERYEKIEIKSPVRSQNEHLSASGIEEGHKEFPKGLLVGRLAPEFRGTDLQDQPFSLADYRGNLVVLFFWGKWCYDDDPSMFQAMREVVRKYQDRNVFVVGVNTDNDPGEAHSFAREKKLIWKSFFDGHLGPIAKQYGVQVFPTAFVISQKGEILSTQPNEIDSTILYQLSK